MASGAMDGHGIDLSSHGRLSLSLSPTGRFGPEVVVKRPPPPGLSTRALPDASA
jgi:hypothetical protein